MSALLQFFLVIICIAFLAYVLLMVRRDIFLLKYSFIWIVLALLGLIAAFFPSAVTELSFALGFETPVNFVFLACILFLMAASFVFVGALSKQQQLVKELVQEISIMRAELDTVSMQADGGGTNRR